MSNLAETSDELGARLNPEHKIWADTYVETKSKRQASKAAGASDNEAALTSYGYRVYRRPDVKAYLDAVFKETAMTAREVIERLNDLASLDLSPILRVSETGILSIDGQKALELGYTRFLKSVGTDSNGLPKYEFMDPQAAQLALGRAHKLFGDSNQLSGPDGGAVPIEMRIVFVDPVATGQQEGSDPSPVHPTPSGAGDVEVGPESAGVIRALGQQGS